MASSSDDSMEEDEASMSEEVKIGDMGKTPHTFSIKQNDLSRPDNTDNRDIDFDDWRPAFNSIHGNG